MADSKQQLMHPIGVVARRTGVPPDLLRAWEKRYRAVVPARTATGRRLYSDEDVQRLRLMKLLIAGKRRISDIANLSFVELTEQLDEDRRESVTLQPESPDDGDRGLDARLAACLEAVQALDGVRLEEELREASVAHSPSQIRSRLLAPLMTRIGDQWQSGELRVMHEHMASAIVRSFLTATSRIHAVDSDLPVMVAATPAGQLHEIGILLAVTVAQELGWRSLYLGPNLPAEEIAAAVRKAGTDTLALSLAYPSADARVADELRRIRHLVGPNLRLLIGGRAAPSYRDVIKEIGGTVLEDLNQLRENLTRV